MNVDPNEQYVRLESWAHLMIPLKLVPMLEKAALVDTEYVDGRHRIKLKDTAISFTFVPKEDVIAAIAASKLE